jgi:predicted kinase
MGKIGNLYIMIGAPGAGKSTLAKKMAEELGGVVYSSDDIREELAHKYGLEGGANNQEVSKEAFDILYERTLSGLLLGKTIFYDASNISRMKRERLISSLREDGAEFNAFYKFLNTPLDVCKNRNKKRYNIQKTDYNKNKLHEPRLVPEPLISRMHNRLERPFAYEGYCDKIITDKNFDINKYILDIRKKSYKENFSFLIKKKIPDFSLFSMQNCFDKIDLALESNNYLNLSLMLKIIGSKYTTESQIDNYMDCLLFVNETYVQLDNNMFFSILDNYLKTDMSLDSLKESINDNFLWDCIKEAVNAEKQLSSINHETAGII